MEECVGEMAKLTMLIIPALIMIRRELDLPMDEAAYRQVVEEGLQKQKTSLKEFLASISDTAAESGAPGDAPRPGVPEQA